MKIQPISFLLVIAAGHASAAIVLTDFTTLTENFNDFNDGTAAKVPSNFVPAHDLGAGAFGGRTLTSGPGATYNASTGWYSLNDNDSPLDFAFGARTNATGGFGTLTFQVTNGTGAAISGITLGFDFKQFSTSAGQSDLNVKGSIDGSTFNTATISGNTTTSVTTGGTADTVFANPIVAARSVSWNSPIADGATVSLRFEWQPVTGGSRPHFGVDNVTITPVPEPGVALLGAIGLLGFAAIRRR